jgi:hypothetical protein
MSRTILRILARVRAAQRTDATPYSIYSLLCETGFASAEDYGALHGYLCNHAEGLDDDMLAARYGTPDDAPPAIPASDLTAATTEHLRHAPCAKRAA